MRHDDLPRLRQLVDCVWFVDVSTPSDQTVQAEKIAAAKAALANRAADAAARADGASAGGSSTVASAQATAADAMAALPYARPMDLPMTVMPDLVLQRTFFADLAKDAGLVSGSRDDDSAALVHFLLDKFLLKQAQLLDEAIMDQQLTLSDPSSSQDSVTGGNPLEVVVPLRLGYLPLAVVLHGCISKILAGTNRIMHNVRSVCVVGVVSLHFDTLAVN